jgi:glycosyltransferase involved in cell wall biosynthesis
MYGGREVQRFEHPLEADRLLGMYATVEERERFSNAHPDWGIQAVDEYSQIWGPRSGGRNNIGLSFNLSVDDGNVNNLNDYFRIMAAGSEWCAQLLRSHNLRAHSIPQGIDPLVFNKSHAVKSVNTDRFVIFSGGKYEFRKGQDYVIKALAHMQQKYSDVYLVTLWEGAAYAHNSMTQSTLIAHSTLQDEAANRNEFFCKVLSENGVDISRALNVPVLNPLTLPHIYRETDLGIFAGRIEGGTNLVLMEYMACGKPVIAPKHTGFGDMINEEHALVLHEKETLYRTAQTQPGIDYWHELDLDELIAHCEWAYHHREELRKYGERGADFVAPFTWERMALEFKKLMS